MIKPTVGRVVLYRPTEEERDDIRHAAIVTMVQHDEMVNLAIFDHNGIPYSCQNVQLVQDDEDECMAGECEWMPYQKGQAARNEELEQLLVQSTTPQDPPAGSEALNSVIDNAVLSGAGVAHSGADGSIADVTTDMLSPEDVGQDVPDDNQESPALVNVPIDDADTGTPQPGDPDFVGPEQEEATA